MMFVTEAMKPQAVSRLQAVLSRTPAADLRWATVRRERGRARFAARVTEHKRWEAMRNG